MHVLDSDVELEEEDISAFYPNWKKVACMQH